MADGLHALWDFDDLGGSEERFRLALEEESSDAGRAEVLTQLARVEGLRGRFDEGQLLLAEAEQAADSEVVRAHVELERGRLLRSGGNPAAALPLFESAFALAMSCGQAFLAVDAAHMAALAAPDRDAMLEWTQRGIDVASAEPAAAYWVGPLLNNLGWDHFEAGEYEPALEAFRRALVAREVDAEKPDEREIARYAFAKALRALGRADEAAPLLEQAVAWTREAGPADEWFHEELAETYSALGRHAEAKEQAAAALALLGESVDADRVARLRELLSQKE